jgi:hypothetical protein
MTRSYNSRKGKRYDTSKKWWKKEYHGVKRKEFRGVLSGNKVVFGIEDFPQLTEYSDIWDFW